MDEKDNLKKGKLFRPFSFIRMLDPLGIVDILKYIRNEKFYLEERFSNSRKNLKHFIDSIIAFFDLDYFSDKIFQYVQTVLNDLLSKTYQIEIDIAGVKKIIFNLYPIRKLLMEHKKVIDVLSNY